MARRSNMARYDWLSMSIWFNMIGFNGFHARIEFMTLSQILTGDKLILHDIPRSQDGACLQYGLQWFWPSSDLKTCIVWMFSTFGVRCDGEFFQLNSGKTGNPSNFSGKAVVEIWGQEVYGSGHSYKKERERKERNERKVESGWKMVGSDEKDETFQKLSPSQVCVTPHVAPSAAIPRFGRIFSNCLKGFQGPQVLPKCLHKNRQIPFCSIPTTLQIRNAPVRCLHSHTYSSYLHTEFGETCLILSISFDWLMCDLVCLGVIWLMLLRSICLLFRILCLIPTLQRYQYASNFLVHTF